MNKFEQALDRIKKNVAIQDDWTTDDMEHYKTVIEALEIASGKEDERNEVIGRRN